MATLPQYYQPDNTHNKKKLSNSQKSLKILIIPKNPPKMTTLPQYYQPDHTYKKNARQKSLSVHFVVCMQISMKPFFSPSNSVSFVG